MSVDDGKRSFWKSRFGFLLAASGSAVGLGNIWRFPYVVGTNGGAAFVFIYLVIVIVVGFPMLVTEITIGKESRKNPIGTFKALAPGTPWWLTGALIVLSAFVILSFYSVVAGWAVSYFIKAARGFFTPESNYPEIFTNHTSHPIAPLIGHGFFMLVTVFVIAKGIVKGIERSVKILMPVMILLLITLVIRSVTLPGAFEGVSFYMKPEFSEITFKTILYASGQAFYSIGLGFGVLLTYASYLPEKETVTDNAMYIIGIDTLVALIAGFAVFPAVFALGFDPAAGAGLAFITIPAVLSEIPGSLFFNSVFFLLLIIAALTSAFSILEVVVSWLIDEHRWSRRKSAVLAGLLIFMFGIPASLSFGPLSAFKIFDMVFFDLLDFLQESFLLPLGGFLTAIFAGYVWKAKRTRDAANRVKGKLILGRWFDVLICYVVPLAIALVMVFGLIDHFKSL
jgi:neurotransmitter:Na+ symporter, NSS family